MHRNLYRRASLESLEVRRLLSLTVATPLSDFNAPGGATSGTVDLTNTFTSSDLAGTTIVQMVTSEGNIDLQLYNTQAPITVANFLSYVNSGQYNNTLFYRADAGFVIQTGTDYPVDTNNNPINLSTPTDTTVGNVIQPDGSAPTIQNEYSDSRPNIEGTIAMAKMSGDPNSASTEWFINLADNSENLDNQNGGFTVFGQVVNGGMTVAQNIGNLSTLGDFGATGNFAELPLINYANGGNIEAGNLVLVPTVSVISGISYSVTSSNSAIVNPSVSGNSLSLAYGQAGSAQITVTATDVLGNTDTDSFNVAVPFSSTVGLSSSTKPKTFTYTDANGTLTTVTLKGLGTMTPFFSSDSALTQSQTKTGTAFSGTNLVLEDLQIQSTTSTSSVAITTKLGNGKTTIEGLSTNSQINTITAKTAILTGNVSITSAKSITANSADGAVMTGQSLSALSLTGDSSFSLELNVARWERLGEKGGAWNNSTHHRWQSVKSVSAASMTGDKICRPAIC